MEQISQDGSFDARYLEKSAESITSGTYIERGDILVAKITPSFENGKQALVCKLPVSFGYATTEVIPLHAKEDNQDHRVLFYYLLHRDVRSHVAGKMEGSTGRQRVPEGALLELPFPEFNVTEQKQIADVLELVQSSIRAQQQSVTHFRDLRLTAMRGLFTHGLRGEGLRDTEVGSIPTTWRLEKVGSHFAVASGGTPSRGVKEYWLEGTIPWVKTTEINYRTINGTEEHISVAGLKHSAAKVFPSGTLLMAMYGQGVTRGRVAILGIDAACNQACAAMSPLDEEVLPRFLYHFLAFRYEEIRRMAHGGQQQNLNLDIVRDLPLIIPDRDEQAEIVSIVDAIDQKAELHKEKAGILEELFRTLLHKLMTGNLRTGDLDLAALEMAPTIEATI
jgi:type I restriction enzyme S subunit